LGIIPSSTYQEQNTTTITTQTKYKKCAISFEGDMMLAQSKQQQQKQALCVQG
jgi:hypothetical protein